MSAPTTAYDHIVIGSGINALVAAAMLGKKGRKVLLLERNAVIGGCLRTEEITQPGFVHDVMATTMVLFVTSPAYAALGKDLATRGLEFAHSPTPTGVLRPDGSHAILSMDRKRNIDHFDALASGDGAAFDREMGRFGGNAGFVFGLLGGNLWSAATAKLVAKEAWKRGLKGLAAFFGEALAPARGYLETTYRSEEMRALFAPWALHCGLGPESAYSAEMTKVIGFAIEMAGCPIVKGGAKNLLAAFEQLIRDQGGTILTNADVEAIVPDSAGRAAGVKLADGRSLTASKGVIASVTPNQLYERLLRDWPSALPTEVADGVKAYRYGKGNMQIHYALSAPPAWKAGADLGRVALLHLTPGLDGVSRSANEAERGLLPAEPTICVGQPASFDPSRAPEGSGLLWLQIPDTPRAIKGDAAGELAIPADGQWTEKLREAFADRIEAILASHIDGFRDTILSRRAYSPADLQAMNINLVGGDPYGGFCGLDQFFLWRPMKRPSNHRTHIAGLYHIGASTHPGPGLGGGSGFLLASSI
ncbi:NAD(P)/FAD-dependent oxidoreductase [Kaistia dalseonensis]|uniref:Pyridine nucleotide-disulfide oxidoreductase domain-containing protein 2 n=1 Tax=Kaistia dalseonensis TaxID=410840 RepID=A0ABU0H7F0_9HYPH|nr:NAD(P)/FAD-dependent oxidoreductase [Kaistia dalseonensis]MCX5495634.1 NAD(P)/FAD-dependent oxidoreductase [Kaistia dalseonensis]MDQ0438227.1 phytoene dehydrogenase-like protein [Kaistia dalseonensis]